MTTLDARFAGALADRYRIERELGQGGMATVWLAHDLRHDRPVAIKVLKAELGAVLGAERFLSEIKVTANLQHPNLLPLFDSGEAEGLLFYVMPFIEGETLRARLEREKQLPVDEAVRLAVAIAQALDHAHRRGVIHRDLKPENILLADGQPLVADFGIALAVSNAGGQRVTQTGLSLGTPQYMSPEQATGDRAVDARTDIYSLGAMTYEMLTGEPPHGGGTAQAIIAKLMTEDVRSLAVLRRSVPAHVDATVRHALEKLAADRFASAGEFALALQGKGDGAVLARYQPRGDGAADRTAGRRTVTTREVLAWGVAATALVAFAWERLHVPATPELPVVRTALEPPPGEKPLSGSIFPLAISPAGDRFAYVTSSPTGYRSVVQHASDPDARVVLEERSLNHLAFSPDGREIAYLDGADLRSVTVDGKSTRPVTNVGNRQLSGLAWTSDGTIVISTTQGVLSVPGSGGTLSPVTRDSTTGSYYDLRVVADGRTILGASETTGEVVAIARNSGEVTGLGMVGSVVGVVDDQLIYATPKGDLLSVAFDARAAKVRGVPTLVGAGVAAASLSRSGTLVYLPLPGPSRLVLAGGGADVVVRPDLAVYGTPRFSPDGKHIALTVSTSDGSDVWILERASGTFTRLTTGNTGVAPEWTSDGTRVLYRSVSSDTVSGKVLPYLILAKRIDGSAPTDTLLKSDDEFYEAVLSRDERWLVVRSGPYARGPRNIYAVDLKGDRKLQPMAAGPASEVMPRLSPDGRWLAYQSDESGRGEVYVRPFPGDGPRVQVSLAGGSEPMWDRAGRTLFYRAPDGITAASVAPGAAFAIGQRALALPFTEEGDPRHQTYDVAPDGAHFLVLRAARRQRLVVAHNWKRELAEKLQQAGR